MMMIRSIARFLGVCCAPSMYDVVLRPRAGHTEGDYG